ncbi:helix-turn-helix domain-containing protein [Bifidobacterium ramosum]|nr:helix-turn-helix transcriptional regulator [Bifidobacterium ramosum]
MFDEAMQDPEMAELINGYMAQMTVGIQLANARDEVGMSMDALSQQSGVAKSTIINIEHGEASPTIFTLTRLAAAMGKTFQTAFV